jgi:ATP-dependent DNA helicase RecQ
MVKRPPVRKPTDDEWMTVRELVRENHAELATPRQLARFLCGMTSPASTRGRLTRHAAFGLLSDLPFADVLAIAESA